MRPLITILVTSALAACGSKAPPPATPATPPSSPAEPAPTAPVATENPAPTEPVKAEPKPDPKVELLAAETAAYDKAKPTFGKYCATCHSKDGKKAAKKKLDHFSLDTYPFGGHHTATIGFTIRDVLGISGKKATMPFDKPGSVQGDDLATIKAWTDAWEAADKAGAHGEVHDAHHDDDDDHDHDHHH